MRPYRRGDGMTSRYLKIANGDDKFIWDTEDEQMYHFDFIDEVGEGEAIYRPIPTTLMMLSKFAPYAEDDGETDEFPGRIVGEKITLADVVIGYEPPPKDGE